MIELHARSAFSFLQGAATPEDLVKRCAELDMPAMALLDRDGLYGAPRFHMAAKKLGIRAHIGAEITATDGSRYPLLVENRTGYQNLCRLITLMKLRAKKGEGAATEEEIAAHAEGLIAVVSGQWPVASLRERIERVVRMFGRGNVYAELQRHFLRDEEERNQAVVDIARSLRLPLLATNGVSYAVPEQREVLDVLTCIRNKVTLDTAGRLLERNSERHLKSAAEMSRLFADLPEAIANTRELSARLAFTLADLGYEFPRYPVPPGEDMNSFLHKLTDEGARRRYRPYYDRARQQIERELALIEKLNLPGYFLIVWDLVRFCREQGILAQGRGSAANSAVCYALGITAVDPVGMDLLFERFLSEERGEWPDIDLDLPSGERRERVIQYVYERYGKRGAAMTANVITYRDRSAARELGKALGDSHPKFMRLFEAMQDLPRHLGQHSGGMVICQGQLDSVVPLEPATMPGRVVVQWDKDDCADMGIVKVDLLGLGMMAVLEETITLIRNHHHEEVDLAHLPPDDPAVYAALQKADTVGMFQVESRAQMATLPRLRPEKFYDLVVQVGIIRPGPIVGKMVHPYLRRRQGREPVDCLHPSLEPVLKRTLGVPLFQEQLLRMAMIAAEFTGGEAEELRRAFSHKRSTERMHEIEVKLRQGMARKGIRGEIQDVIVQSITSFALYGFPESHAASFALLAYASAWLKVHYLAAFTAALLNNQPMGFYHPATIIKDAQRHGIRILPIDVTCSDWDCTLEEGCVRLGLKYVRGLRESPARAIVSERPFASIDDLARRVPGLHKDELRTLAEVGALNSVAQVVQPAGPRVVSALEKSARMPTLHAGQRAPLHRRDALWESEKAARSPGPLFENPPDPDAASPLKQMTAEERVNADFRGTGLTIGRHPMAYQRAEMDRLGVTPAIRVARTPNGRHVRIAGCVIVRQRPGTAKGLIFVSLEDETGISNAVIMPDVFAANRLPILSEPFLLIEGVLQNADNVAIVRAERIAPLEMAMAGAGSHDFR